MCKKFEIARNTVVSFIVEKDCFSYDELQNKILNDGGVLRISTTQTLDNYLNYYEKSGFIKYSPKTKSFFIIKY